MNAAQIAEIAGYVFKIVLVVLPILLGGML